MEIDIICERFDESLETLRTKLNSIVGEGWQEWEVPRDAAHEWPAEAKDIHDQWWEQWISRQKEKSLLPDRFHGGPFLPRIQRVG